MTVNGDDVEFHYGDKVVSLDERLAEQDRQIKWLQRAVIGLGGLIAFHVLLPGEDVISFLLSLIGL